MLDTKCRRNRDFYLLVSVILLCVESPLASQKTNGSESSTAEQSPRVKYVTVADCIDMAKFEESDDSEDSVAKFSPDGSEFVVVLRRGDLRSNTNHYSLLLWHVTHGAVSPRWQTLLTMSSSSTRAAIEMVKWLNDSETVTFLGERPHETHALYQFNTRTRVLKRIAHLESNILSYGISLNGKRIGFVAERRPRNLTDHESDRQGIIVSHQLLTDLIALKEKSEPGWGRPRTELLVGQNGGHFRPITVPDTLYYHSPYAGPFLSPDGNWLVVRDMVSALPAHWRDYSNVGDPELRLLLQPSLFPGDLSVLSRYVLIDLQTGNSRILLDTPLTPQFSSEVAWSPDSRSIALGHVYFPLPSGFVSDRTERVKKRIAVEVSVSDLSLTIISEEDNLQLLGWDTECHCVRFSRPDSAIVDFRKSRGQWQPESQLQKHDVNPTILVREGMNVPPQLVAVSRNTLTSTLLMDPNPQFRNMRFAPVKEIQWQGRDGHEIKGGLYYPVDYIPGRRYPLVIQTHDWNTNRFWIDGPWTTAYAAQPLAAKSMFVLQASEDYSNLDSITEIRREVSALEGAIDYLQSAGLIDPEKVGLIGFSRTGLFVSYALIHSKCRFAAASVADSLDNGYLQYLSTVNLGGFFTEPSEEINGGLPFSGSLATWVNYSASGFRASDIHTPIRIEDNSPGTLLSNWELFGALTRLHRPVELVYLPEAGHVLEKPWDRMVSQQGNVDWFDFWLNGREDPAAPKSAQYTRWHKLRAIAREEQLK